MTNTLMIISSLSTMHIYVSIYVSIYIYIYIYMFFDAPVIYTLANIYIYILL